MLQHTRCATANYTLKCSSNTRDTEQGGLKHQHHTYQDNWYLRTLTKKFSKHQMSGNVLCWNITHEHFIVQKLYMKLPVLTLRYKAYWACYLQFPCVQQIFKVFYVTKGNFTADKHMHTHWPPLKNFKNKLTLCSALFLEKGNGMYMSSVFMKTGSSSITVSIQILSLNLSMSSCKIINKS